MIARPISQPDNQFGEELRQLLAAGTHYSRIAFISAFVALRSLLRFRQVLLAHNRRGTDLRFVIGIDLGGTSREVLEELLRWGCTTYIFHNSLSRATFHPKVYLLEKEAAAILFIGSNNLTDGGLYTNYEVTTRYDFSFPRDSQEYGDALATLDRFLNPQGVTAKPLDRALIDTLVARGELPTEADARRRTGKRARAQRRASATLPPSPFSGVGVGLPPLLPRQLRGEDQPLGPQIEPTQTAAISPQVTLVWRKTLTRSDALQVRTGTAHVGGVRLVQARFENPPGERIDHTTYFRNLFADYRWTRETGRHRAPRQEHAFVPMRLIICGRDLGVHNFEISHKPSGEAGQRNYTTILRWGRDFNRIVPGEHLAGTVLSLYETDDGNVPFIVEITDQANPVRHLPFRDPTAR